MILQAYEGIYPQQRKTCRQVLNGFTETLNKLTAYEINMLVLNVLYAQKKIKNP